MKALMISADEFEDAELLFPFYRLKEAGLTVDVAAPAAGKIRGKHGYEVKVDKALSAVDPDAYDLLVLPGGKAPAKVREAPEAIAIAKRFMDAGKAVAAICHGPQILISADALRGRRVTCSPAVAEEIKQAGARYEDQEVVVDGNLVTSRQPGDLPAFMREMLRRLPASTA